MGVITTYFIALALAVKFKRSFSDTAMISIMGIIVVIYAFGLCGYLPGGVYLVQIISTFALFYCLVSFVKNQSAIKTWIVSPASLAYIAFVLFFGIFNFGRSLSDSDDLLQWGLQVKNICYYDKLNDARFTSISKYPQATMMWEYFANKTWVGFSDSITLWAYDVYTLTALLPFFDYVSERYKISKWLCMFFCVLLIPTMAYPGAYSRLSANTLSSLICFWCIYQAYQFHNDHYHIHFIALILGVFCLTITIRAGFILAVYPIAFWTYFMILEHKKKWLRYTLVPPAVCCVSYASYDMLKGYIGMTAGIVGVICSACCYIWIRAWEHKHRDACVAVIFGTTAALAILFELLLGNRSIDNHTGNEIIGLFFEHVFTTSQGVAINFLPISLSTFLMLFVFGILIYHKRSGNGLKDSLNIQLMILCVLCNLVFLAGYIVAYIVFIGELPFMNVLPSFPRYMTPCYLIDIFLVLYLLMPKLIKKMGSYFWYVLPMAVLLVVNCSYFISDWYNRYQLPKFYAFEQQGVELTANDKVYYINLQDPEANYSDIAFYYEVMPAISNFSRQYAGESDLVISGNEDGTGFCNQLATLGYDYVYIQTVNDSFLKNYSHCFENANSIHAGTVYQLINVNGAYKLVIV